jgi:hypothetical protein
MPKVQAPDAQHPQYFSGMSLAGIAPDGLLHLGQPSPSWRNPSDCGVGSFARADGSVVPLNCAGLKHALYKDVDSSLFPRTADLVATTQLSATGAWAGLRHASGYDQGTAVVAGTCSLQVDRDAYVCATPGVEGRVSLLSGYVQLAPPPAGLFGKLDMFVIESRDRDSEDRDFGPVTFESNGALLPTTSSSLLAWMATRSYWSQSACRSTENATSRFLDYCACFVVHPTHSGLHAVASTTSSDFKVLH